MRVFPLDFYRDEAPGAPGACLTECASALALTHFFFNAQAQYTNRPRPAYKYAQHRKKCGNFWLPKAVYLTKQLS